MKKTILAIFAHPDDEAFGPGGTLALLSKTHDVYVLYVSKGQSGEVHGRKVMEEKAKVRQEEGIQACRELGAKGVYFLNFQDGLLCNNEYHKIARAIEKKVEKLRPDILITFESRGFTGHLDHVLVSNVTTFVFQKTDFIKKLMYFCIDEKQRAAVPEYYIYFPPGYKTTEIDECIDVSSVWENKMKAIDAHTSQKKDKLFYQSLLHASGKKENFVLGKK